MTIQDPVMTQHTPIITYGKPTKIKLVLLGESAVGKSSLVLRFVQKEFNENSNATIGAAFVSQKCYLEDRVIKFEIWDTAGQERFHSLAPMYYRNAQAAIVVYDITQHNTFERAKQWVKELHDQAGEEIVIALVGNKFDLNENRQVELEEATTYATFNNLIFHETSAKDAVCVDQVFKSIGNTISYNIKNKPENTIKKVDTFKVKVDVGDNIKQKEKNNCAC